MAKRKRLTPATAIGGDRPPAAQHRVSGAPIAHVAGSAAAQAALDALATEMHAARTTGRLVQDLPLDAVQEDHMVRDRMVEDPQEMAALKASLASRGQQTPIEVVALENGQYGLISGWRRLHALRGLLDDTQEPRFGTVQALIKPIDSVSDSYVAMVEENEIRVGLSFYERAHLACAAANLGVYESASEAVQALFSNAPAAKRSKIKSFVKLHERLGDVLRFPTAIPEKLGLRLVAALEDDAGFPRRLNKSLQSASPESAEAEREVLEGALSRGGATPTPQADPEEVAPGIKVAHRKGRVVISGPRVTDALQKDLTEWLSTR